MRNWLPVVDIINIFGGNIENQDYPKQKARKIDKFRASNILESIFSYNIQLLCILCRSNHQNLPFVFNQILEKFRFPPKNGTKH